MIEILPIENEDLDFIGIVKKILNTSLQSYIPNEIFVFKIDNWFDFKWQSFSGNTMGAVGVWHNELRIPPFIPNRVLEQKYFKRFGETYNEREYGNLHVYQQSDANFNRKITLVSNSGLFLWFSGNTKNNLRGSIMLYQVEDQTENSWYVSFVKSHRWRIDKTEGISNNEVLALI